MDSTTFINDVISRCERRFSEMTLIKRFSTCAEHENDRISDVVVLDSDVILVADSTHCVVKAFNMDGDFLSRSDRLDQHADGGLAPEEIDQQEGGLFGPMHSIFRMTVIDKTSVAVTLPGSNKFAVVLLTPENNFFIRFVKKDTYHRYWTIAFTPDKKYICSTERLVDVMTLDFKPIGRLTSEFDFRIPCCIAVSGNGDVVIADAEKQCIVAVGCNGYIFHQLHLGIRSLRGIDLDGNTIFFISSQEHHLSYYSTEGKIIHVVRAKCAQDGLDTPTSIQYLGNGNVIIGEEGGHVKIYHLENYYRATQWVTRWRNIRHFCFASLPWRQLNEMIGIQGVFELLIFMFSH